MDDLRWGILGCGEIARGVTPCIARAEGCVAWACAARSAERAAEFAAANELPGGASTYDELAERDDLDAVYVTLPNHLHVEWSCRLLEAGKHVLCEKPLTWKAAEAERVFATAERCGRLFAEGFMYQHHPQTERLVEIARSGAAGPIGELLRIEGWFELDILHVPTMATRLSHEMFGGAFMDLGVYPFGMARLLVGEEPEELDAAARFHEPLPDETRGVDVATLVEGRFPGGVTFRASCTMDGEGWEQGRAGVRLVGTDGILLADLPWRPHPTRSVLTITRPARTPEDRPVEHIVLRDGGERFQNQFERFARAVRGADEMVPSGAWTIAQAAGIERVHEAIGIGF